MRRHAGRFFRSDRVVPLYIPECRACENCCSQKTNLCTRIEETQGAGVMPDGTTRFTCTKDGVEREILHFMGTSTFSEYTVCAEISVAKVRRDAPLEKVCLLGCGVTTGYGAVLNTMKVCARESLGVLPVKSGLVFSD